MACYCPGQGSDECYMCYGLRGHKAIKNAMSWEFARERDWARGELLALEAILDDAKWFNFEMACRNWREPWHESFGASRIRLRAVHRDHVGHCTFPYWFNGPVQDASPLPLAILETEVQMAKEYLAHCERCVAAPYDWAPGGVLYEALRATTMVPTSLPRGKRPRFNF